MVSDLENLSTTYKQNLISEIGQNCLFKVTSYNSFENQVNFPKCKHKLNRLSAFNLLELGFQKISKENHPLLDHWITILKNAQWRSSDYRNWQIQSMVQ